MSYALYFSKVRYKYTISPCHTDTMHVILIFFFQDSSCLNSLDAYGFLLEAIFKSHYVVFNILVGS